MILSMAKNSSGIYFLLSIVVYRRDIVLRGDIQARTDNASGMRLI